MKNIKNNNLLNSVKIIVLGLILATGVSYLSAWTGPLSSAPDCVSGNPGCDAPLNVGPSSQSKLGQLFINTSVSNPFSIGLSVFGESVFTSNAGQPAIAINDGSAAPGKVLTATDANGTATWATPVAAAGSCPNGQFVTGFNTDGTLICNSGPSLPLVSIGISDDEQVYINIKGTTVTLTNMTRNGATLTSAKFGLSTGMPQDGKPLALYNVVGRNTPTIIQQPSSANNYTTIIKIWDGQAGAGTYSFDVNYATAPQATSNSVPFGIAPPPNPNASHISTE